MTLLDQFGLPQDVATPLDPPFSPLDTEPTVPLDTKRAELQDFILDFTVNNVDENRVRLFSNIVTHALSIAKSEQEEPETFGLTTAEIKGAKKGELSFNPAKERDIVTSITLAIYNTQLWQHSQSHQPAAEPEPPG